MKRLDSSRHTLGSRRTSSINFTQGAGRLSAVINLLVFRVQPLAGLSLAVGGALDDLATRDW